MTKREIDAKVAEALGAGWQDYVPHYSTDIAAAWSLMYPYADSKVFAVGFDFRNKRWGAEFMPRGKWRTERRYATTAPLAICLAFVEAMTGQRIESEPGRGE